VTHQGEYIWSKILEHISDRLSSDSNHVVRMDICLSRSPVVAHLYVRVDEIPITTNRATVRLSQQSRIRYCTISSSLLSLLHSIHHRGKRVYYVYGLWHIGTDELRHQVRQPASQCNLTPLFRCLFSSQNFTNFFKILRHIESLDACMKH